MERLIFNIAEEKIDERLRNTNILDDFFEERGKIPIRIIGSLA